MIVYFTGTGNTGHCAKLLARDLRGEHMHRLTPTELINPAECTITVPEGDRRLVWMTPVHSWGLPPVVSQIMAEATIKNGKKCTHHLVVTCGDDTGRMAPAWRELMHARGFKTGAAFSVQMPNTYVSFPGFDTDKTDLEQKKIDMAVPRIGEIAAMLRSGVPCGDQMTEGGLPIVKSRFIHPLFVRNLLTARHFKASDTCTGCGRCTRVCPVANISLGDSPKRPVWQKNCTLCLACYHACPVHAISYGMLTRGKGHYNRIL